MKSCFSIPPNGGNNTLRILAIVIVCSLRYYGCNAESISRVLKSYQLNHSSAEVTQYVQRNQLIEYPDEKFQHPRKITYMSRNEDNIDNITTVCDFNLKRPMKMTSSCNRLPAYMPVSGASNVIVQAADGRRIKTTVTREEVSFSICR